MNFRDWSISTIWSRVAIEINIEMCDAFNSTVSSALKITGIFIYETKKIFIKVCLLKYNNYYSNSFEYKPMKH